METDTQLLSPNPMNKTQEEEDDDDNDEPSTPPVIILSGSPERQPLPPPQLRTSPASNPANTYSKKSKSLQVNIEQPPSNGDAWPRLSVLRFHLCQEPLLVSGGYRSSLTAPTQEDLPQEELSPPRERRTKLKHDQRPKKRPRG